MVDGQNCNPKREHEISELARGSEEQDDAQAGEDNLYRGCHQTERVGGLRAVPYVEYQIAEQRS